jgi:hypothetical protein
MSTTAGEGAWSATWEDRLRGTIRALGFTGGWEYVQGFPGETYEELALRAAACGNHMVAPLQIETLQSADTPPAELPVSVRDSLARHLRQAFTRHGWREGPYWEGKAIGALISWSAMWSARIDLKPLKPMILNGPMPVGWVPADASDSFLRRLVSEDLGGDTPPLE